MGHGQAGAMPQPRDDDRVYGHVLIDEPVEGEVRKTQVPHELLQPQLRIEEPLPGHACDDERHGEGVEKDRAKDTLRTDILVDEDGQKKAEDEATRYEQHAEYRDVLGGDQE